MNLQHRDYAKNEIIGLTPKLGAYNSIFIETNQLLLKKIHFYHSFLITYIQNWNYWTISFSIDHKWTLQKCSILKKIYTYWIILNRIEQYRLWTNVVNFLTVWQLLYWQLNCSNTKHYQVDVMKMHNWNLSFAMNRF